jgi:hypothetical protein
MGVLNALTQQSGVDILGVRETRRATSATTAEGCLGNYHFKINWLCDFFFNRIELTGVSVMLISDA